MRRAIVGGTFDPPHLAHLAVGEAAYRQLGVDVVTFMPAGAPWQKSDRVVTAARHRWAMTQLAVQGVGYFQPDDREVMRDGWTYTVETLRDFEGDEIVLVLGADAAARLSTWHEADEVRDRARIAVARRPGTSRSIVEDGAGTAVEWLDVPKLDISGSELRARAASGGSLRFLVREAVWEYIETHSIYG